MMAIVNGLKYMCVFLKIVGIKMEYIMRILPLEATRFYLRFGAKHQ